MNTNQIIIFKEFWGFFSCKLIAKLIAKIVASKCLLHFRKGKNHPVFEVILVLLCNDPLWKKDLKRGGISSKVSAYSLEILHRYVKAKMFCYSKA